MFRFINKGSLIFLASLLLAGVLTTAGLVLFHNRSVQKLQERGEVAAPEYIGVQAYPEKILVPDGLGVESLHDKYNMNDLKMINGHYTIGEATVHHSEYGDYEWTTYPVAVDTLQIDGLKDKAVQDAINSEILAIIEKMIPENPDSENPVYISSGIMANFSNVISMYINGTNTEALLNFNLVTGEKLKLEDIFTNTANIKNIIMQSAYNDIMLEEFGYNWDESAADYSAAEELLFNTALAYNNTEEFEFYFSATHLYVRLNENIISVPLRNYYKDIAVFNRFAGGNIYDGRYNNGKNIFVFVDRSSENSPYFRLEEIDGRLLIDITVIANKNEPLNKAAVLVEQEMELKISKYKEKIAEDLDNAYAFGCTVYLSSNNDTISAYVDCGEFKTSKAYYDSEFFEYLMGEMQYRDKVSIDGNYEIYDENILKHVEVNSRFEERDYDISSGTYTITESRYDTVLRDYVIGKISTFDAATGDLLSEQFFN